VREYKTFATNVADKINEEMAALSKRYSWTFVVHNIWTIEVDVVGGTEHKTIVQFAGGGDAVTVIQGGEPDDIRNLRLGR
jgi:hypothetical protein